MWGFIVVGMPVLLICAVASVYGVINGSLLAPWICVIALVTMYAWIRGSFSRNWFDPLLIVSTFLSLSFLLPWLNYTLFGFDPFMSVWRIWPSLQASAFAMQVGASALLAFFVGYVLAPIKLKTIPAYSDGNSVNLKIVPDIYFVLGISITLLYLIIVGPSTILTNLHDRLDLLRGRYVFMLGPYFILASYLLRIAESQKMDVLHLVIVLAALALLGSKAALLLALVTTACMRHWIKPLKPIYMGIFGLFGALTYVGYALVFRELIPSGTLSRVYADSWPLDLYFRITSSAFFGYSILVGLYDLVPHVLPFQSGRTLLPLLYAFAPRVLFPDKPISPSGMLTLVLAPERLASGTTVPPSLIGEMYINWGFPGVISSMLLLGLVARFTVWWANRSSFGKLVYAVWIAHLPLWLRGETFSPTVSFLILLILLWLGVRISGYGRGIRGR